MPILDMPLSQLKTYQGMNPCPADIDEFWDRAIKEMEKLGAGFELKKADFQVPHVLCYDMYFTGVGCARIHAKLVRPEKMDQPMPALCYFHGYSERSPDFFHLLSYVQSGFVVAALDCRGQGGESEDTSRVKGNTLNGHIIRGLYEMDPEKLLFRDIFLDAAQLARIVMKMPFVDEKRVGAVGGSQGGGLTLACAALTPELNSAAPAYPFLCDYKRVWDMDLDCRAYAELREYFRYFDPLHERIDDLFLLLGYIDNQHLAHRIKARILMFTALLDDVCPPSTQFAAYNRMSCEKQMVIYPDFGHEALPYCEEKTIAFMRAM
jgi:cephalosporin-C deacetylase